MARTGQCARLEGSAALPAFQVMVKPHGPVCNLDCKYCYYLCKEALYPASSFRMTYRVLEVFTRDYIQAQAVPEVVFVWQGGEPTLMGLEFFRHAVELQAQYRRPHMRIHNALQTNGTLLNDDWCRFFREHDFLIGVSLDGPRDLHDALRTDRCGQPTFERVIAGINLLKQHGVEFNVLTAVHAANAPHPLEVYRFLRDEVGAAFIQFIPVVERGIDPDRQAGQCVSTHSVTARQYGEFLCSIFDEWVRRDVGRTYVQIFDMALSAWVGQMPTLCVMAETCGLAMVLEHNGDLYSCDHFVEPRHRLGNILDTPLATLATSVQQRLFGLAKRERLPDYCRACPVYFVCHGGCPKDRFLRTPDGEPGLNYLCEGFRRFFTHIEQPMRFMATELRAGRPPANIRTLLAWQQGQRGAECGPVGRNDPCPCGSGRKFKHCHGRRAG